MRKAMEMLPPAGWADVATKQDLALFATELRAGMAELDHGLNTEMAELAGGLRIEMADLRAGVEHSLRIQLMWTITTMVAGFGGIAAVVGLTG